MNKEILKIQSKGNVLRCNYYKNFDSKGLVIILPGDSSTGSDSSSYNKLISDVFSNNYSVLGINFLSQSDSDGHRTDLNISEATDNFNDVFDFMISKFPNYNNCLWAVCSSFGASVFLNSNLSKYFKKVVFKSPAINLALAYENDEGGLNNIIKWKEDGISLNSGLKFSAYVDSLRFNAYKFLEKENLLSGLIIVGSDDEIVSLEDIKRFKVISGFKVIELKGVTHSYKTNNGIRLFTKETTNFLFNQNA